MNSNNPIFLYKTIQLVRKYVFKKATLNEISSYLIDYQIKNRFKNENTFNEFVANVYLGYTNSFINYSNFLIEAIENINKIINDIGILVSTINKYSKVEESQRIQLALLEEDFLNLATYRIKNGIDIPSLNGLVIQFSEIYRKYFRVFLSKISDKEVVTILKEEIKNIQCNLQTAVIYNSLCINTHDMLSNKLVLLTSDFEINSIKLTDNNEKQSNGTLGHKISTDTSETPTIEALFAEKVHFELLFECFIENKVMDQNRKLILNTEHSKKGLKKPFIRFLFDELANENIIDKKKWLKETTEIKKNRIYNTFKVKISNASWSEGNGIKGKITDYEKAVAQKIIIQVKENIRKSD